MFFGQENNMRKIFLLEDDRDIREVMELILTAENYTVESFGSIREFTQRDTSINPDLYLFDVMLPDGSGIELCKELRKSNTKDTTPVVIMSAHASIADLNGICEPEDFIAKPFDVGQLLDKIRAVLG